MGTKSVDRRSVRWCSSGRTWVTREKGGDTVVHLEPHRLVAAPPAAQPRSVTFFAPAFFLHVYGAVLFVHEEARDGAGARVEVLVVAPGGEVDAPLVQLEVNIANSVREVPAYQDAFGVRVGGDVGDIKVLAGVVLDTV